MIREEQDRLPRGQKISVFQDVDAELAEQLEKLRLGDSE